MGYFRTDAQIAAPFGEIRSTGFFFDEVNNSVSNAQITLRTISEFVSGETVNVNILTQLASERARAGGHRLLLRGRLGPGPRRSAGHVRD